MIVVAAIDAVIDAAKIIAPAVGYVDARVASLMVNHTATILLLMYIQQNQKWRRVIVVGRRSRFLAIAILEIVIVVAIVIIVMLI